MAEIVASASIGGAGSAAGVPSANKTAKSAIGGRASVLCGTVKPRTAEVASEGVIAATGLRTVPHLLPRNASKFEIAGSEITGRVDHIETPLRDLWRPEDIRADLLPWLAWALSVDHWDDDWPTERKRAVVMQAIEVHRRKGTLWAIKQNVRFIDGEVVRAITPPDTFFPGRSTSKAERNAWLARFPEVRLFAFRDRGERDFGAYTNSTGMVGRKAFLGDNAGATFYPRATTAPDRIGRNAFIYRDGVQIAKAKWRQRQADLEVIRLPDEEVIQWPGERQCVTFAGDKPSAKMILQRSSAPSRYYTVNLDRERIRFDFHLTGVPGSLEPVNVNPERVAQQGKAVGLFAGQPLHGELKETDAWVRLYDSFRLHEPTSLPRRQARLPHIGFVRLGMPAYHARLDVLYTRKQSPKRFGRFVEGFFVASDPKRIERLRRAVRWAKSARDKVWINTRVHRLPRVGDPLRVGELTVGEHIRDY